MNFATPAWLRRELEYALRRAGFGDAMCAKVRYKTVDERECLVTSVLRYGSVVMSGEELTAYERVVKAMPGVLRTEVIRERDTGSIAPPRGQVRVVHLRRWEEP